MGISTNLITSSGEFEKERNFWLENLSGNLTVSSFPFEYSSAKPDPLLREVFPFSFPGALSHKLLQVTNRSPYGLFMILLAGINYILRRHTGSDDIIVGVPVFKQNEEAEYINHVLTLRTRIEDGRTFKEFLGELKNIVNRANEHQNYPFQMIADALNWRNGDKSLPLFDVMLNFENIHDRRSVRDIQAPMVFSFYMSDNGIELNLEYDTGMYLKATAQNIVGHLGNFLEAVMRNPDINLMEIEILSDAEKNRILYEFNDTRADYSRHKTLPQLFEEQAEKTPENIAVVFDGEAITYRELNCQSNRLAHFLSRAGVGVGEPVAVLMDRSPDMIAVVYGILKAGGAYVPLEANFPKTRIIGILSRLKVKWLVTQNSSLALLRDSLWEAPQLTEIILFDINTPKPPLEKINTDETIALWDAVSDLSVDRVTAGGFFSAYTGQPFSGEEIDQYRDHVAEMAAPFLGPDKRVLEVGCGSGLIMFEIAPGVANYVGLDPSGATQKRNREYVTANGYANIELVTGFAHEIESWEAAQFDLVILASTVQFFPGYVYLSNMVENALRVLKPGGAILFADIMDPRRKADYIKSVDEFKRSHQSEERFKTKTGFDGELYVDGEFFSGLQYEFPRIAEVKVFGRKGFVNELQYRYDVIIQKSQEQPASPRADSSKPLAKPARNIVTRWHVNDLPDGNLPRAASPDDIAYIIHTSGSTGEPKGVAVRHRPVINIIEWVNKNFDVGPEDRLLFITSLCFDLSVYDIFGVLASGGSIRVVSRNELVNPESLLHILNTEPITFWDSAPAALQQLAPLLPDNLTQTQKSKLRLVFLSGDWIPVTLPDALKNAFPDVRVISLGGATEATIWSNYYPISQVDPRWVSIPYGKPIQNSKYYILDSFLRPCPVGAPGDLYIGGECLASGYINDLFLTGEKFIPNPFVPGETIYKTGDLARWYSDGNMEFLGRKDQQVKIRGYRIELGEIESKLLKHSSVKEAVVVDKSDGGGNKYLCAYIVWKNKLSVTGIREYLSAELPDYMIPSYFVDIEKIPLTSNGKTDRRSLPEPDGSIFRGAEYSPPRNQVEEELVRIWQEVLGIERIGINDNFFELGGDSLKAVRVAGCLEGYSINVRSILEHPTIAQLQEYVIELDTESTELPPAMAENLAIEYFFLKNGEPDPIARFLDCNTQAIYFIMKKKVKDYNRYFEFLLQDIVFYITQNPNGAIYDINVLEYPFRGDIFKVNYCEGRGFEVMSVIEKLLDKGEQVIIGTFPRRVPFNKDFEGFEKSFLPVKKGHTFLAVAHDDTHLYYVEIPDVLNVKNFVPYPKNKSVGMIAKTDLKAAFEAWADYGTLMIDETNLRQASDLKGLFNITLENYAKGICCQEGFKISYGKDALDFLIRVCGAECLQLDTVEGLNTATHLCHLFEWKLFSIGARRKILSNFLMGYTGACNPQVRNRLIDVLDKSYQEWHRTSEFTTRKFYVDKDYLVGRDYQARFTSLKALEEEIMENLAALWK